VRRVDPALPVTNVATQVDLLDRRVARERLFATTYAIFGGLALVLASLGLFGVLSYSVSRRTNEIGVRMALGARRLDVARMMLTESLVLVGLGAGLGLGAAWLSGGAVASLVYGLAPRDTATFAMAIAVIVGVSLLAASLPTRRATRVDPMVALRQE
jgi:ABC-type antimicrobial peptide transport system permease subunit